MDTNTLMLMMAMGGGGNMRNMLPLLLLTGGLGGDTSSELTSPNALLGAMIPGGSLVKYMIGGLGAVALGSMLRPRRRRRRTRVIYRNRRRRYY